MMTTIMAKIGDYVIKDFKIRDYVERTIKRIGKDRIFQNLLTSFWAGISANKINWGHTDEFGNFIPYIDENGYTSAKNLMMLPPDSILLTVTPEGYLDDDAGLLQYYYNFNSGFYQNPKAFSNYGNAPLAAFSGYMVPQRSVGFTPMFVSTIPEAWRLIHTFNPIGLAGNHYGDSMIRSIFKDVVDLANLDYKIQIASTYKAYPLAIVETDSSTEVFDPTTGTSISQKQNFLNIIPEAAKTGYAVIDGLGSINITQLDNTANLEQMAQLRLTYLDSIRAGLCSPNLTGNNSSYANAVSNNDNLDTVIHNFTLSFIDTANLFIKKLIDVAFGEQYEYGTFEILDNSLDDKSIWLKILEGGKNIGILDLTNLEDVNTCRNKIGLSPVDKISDDMLMAARNNMQSPATNMGEMKQGLKKPYANGMRKENGYT